jgi:hypothetical protein
MNIRFQRFVTRKLHYSDCISFICPTILNPIKKPTMRKALRSQAILACILFLSFSVFAQGPGYIIRQSGTTNLGSGGTTGAFPSTASVTGREI